MALRCCALLMVAHMGIVYRMSKEDYFVLEGVCLIVALTKPTA